MKLPLSPNVSKFTMHNARYIPSSSFYLLITVFLKNEVFWFNSRFIHKINREDDESSSSDDVD